MGGAILVRDGGYSYVRVCSIQKENNWDKLVLYRIAVAGFFYSEEENNWGKLGLIRLAVA